MAERRLLLLAAGGHGSVLLDALHACGADVYGIIDPGKPVGMSIFNVPVLGDDAWLDQAIPDDFVLVNGIGASPRSASRRRLFETWKNRGFDFLSVRHPFTFVGREVNVGEGGQVMAGAVLQCGVSIEPNVVINTRASIDHDCTIGAHTFVGPGVTLSGGVSVGSNAFLGAGAVVLPGISIGNEAIIGAGAVVTRDVCGSELVCGNPAKAKGHTPE